MLGFSSFFAMRVCSAYFIAGQQNTVKIDARGTSELPRDDAKTTKIRSVSIFDSARCTRRARATLRGRPGPSRHRPGNAFGRCRGTLGLPWASQDRSRGTFLAPRSLLKRVLARPPDDFERPRTSKTEISSFFHRFWSICRRLLLDLDFVRHACRANL